MNNLLTEIHKAIQKAVLIVGNYPNKIVLGANVYSKLNIAPTRVFVGYMQEVEAGEIGG